MTVDRLPGLTLHIGLTGGIGSGKSTVAGLLAKRGAVVIDADAFSRLHTAVGGAAIGAIAQVFGETFITAEGALDRVRMRELVFADPSAKGKLEAIVHPLVAQSTARATALAEAAHAPCVLFDIPLLVESRRWRPLMHQVLVVDCTEERQISRVIARSGWSREAVQQVMAGQASRAQRLAAADACIYNDSLTLEALAAQVQELAPRFGL